MFPRNENRNEGTFAKNHPFTKPPFYLPMTLFGVDNRVVSKRVVSADVPPGTKTGTRVRSPKPPFYETALLSPSEKGSNFSLCGPQTVEIRWGMLAIPPAGSCHLALSDS